MVFFVRLGADPPPHYLCGKGLQRRLAEKDTISRGRICESGHLALQPGLDPQPGQRADAHHAQRRDGQLQR